MFVVLGGREGGFHTLDHLGLHRKTSISKHRIYYEYLSKQKCKLLSYSDPGEIEKGKKSEERHPTPEEYHLHQDFIFMCFPACLSVHHSMQYMQRSQESIWSPGTEVTGACKLPCRCWEPYLEPLQEQLVLLTAEQSLQLCAPLLLNVLLCMCMMYDVWQQRRATVPVCCQEQDYRIPSTCVCSGGLTKRLGVCSVCWAI